VDAVYARAIDAGAAQLFPVEDQFYGDRIGALTDPFGHIWYVSTRQEDLSHDEIARRMAAQSKRKE
jgi:PhnB protein